MPKNRNITRRVFVKTTAAIGAVTLVGLKQGNSRADAAGATGANSANAGASPADAASAGAASASSANSASASTNANAASAASASASNSASASATEPTPNEEQYGFLVRVKNCKNCLKCIEACRAANKTPDNEEARIKLTAYTNSAGKEFYVPTSCMHCDHPACATVCPAGAISKGKGGIVVVDHNRCIGCKYCYQACPISVPHYPPQGMDKCDYCLESGVPLGERTNCSRVCAYRCLYHGTASRFEALVGDKLVRVGGPTGPSLYLSFD